MTILSGASESDRMTASKKPATEGRLLLSCGCGVDILGTKSTFSLNCTLLFF